MRLTCGSFHLQPHEIPASFYISWIAVGSCHTPAPALTYDYARHDQPDIESYFLKPRPVVNASPAEVCYRRLELNSRLRNMTNKSDSLSFFLLIFGTEDGEMCSYISSLSLVVNEDVFFQLTSIFIRRSCSVRNGKGFKC